MSGEKTEAATPHKLRQLREEGRVTRSADLTTAAGLLTALVVLRQLGGDLTSQLGGFVEQRLSNLAELAPSGARADLTDAGLADFSRAAMWVFIGALTPLLIALPLAGVLSNVGQVGFILSGKGLKPDFNHLNPLSGLKKMFSTRSAVELLKTLVKVGILTFLLYRTYVDSVPTLLATAGADLRAAVPMFMDLSYGLGMTVGVAFLTLGFLDYGYQRWQFKRDARMSKDDVKQEYKQARAFSSAREVW